MKMEFMNKTFGNEGDYLQLKEMGSLFACGSGVEQTFSCHCQSITLPFDDF